MKTRIRILFTLSNILSLVVYIMFFCLMLFLWVMALFSSTYIQGDFSEHSFYLADRPFLNLLFLFLFILTLLIVKRLVSKSYLIKPECINKNFHLIRRVLLLLIFSICVGWTLIYQLSPGYDQYLCQNAAAQLFQKNYSMFSPGEYMNAYPNQYGLVLFSYIFSLLFGSYNYLAFQLVNALCITLIYKALSDIMSLWEYSQFSQILIIVMGILYFPLLLYTTFVYGTVIGLWMSLYGIKNGLQFYETGKISHALLSSIALGFSVMIKQNYLIFAVGIIVYTIFQTLRKRKWKILLLSFLVPVFVYGQYIIVNSFIFHTTQKEISNGVSPWAFVAMGMQESGMAPGWYNGYVFDSYRNVGADTSRQKELALKEIDLRIEKFKDDPEYAFGFFLKKIASQWNEASSESLWNQQIRESKISLPEWVWFLKKEKTAHFVRAYLDIVYFIILSGVIGFLFKSRWKKTKDILLFSIIIIGGFIFHLMWEAKSAYSLSYIVLFLPFCSAFYSSLNISYNDIAISNNLSSVLLQKKITFNKLRIFFITTRLIPIILVCMFYFFLLKQGYLKNITGDDKKYFERLEENDCQYNQVIPEGQYLLRTVNNPESYVHRGSPNGSNYDLIVSYGYDEYDDLLPFCVIHYQNSTKIYVKDTFEYLDRYDSSDIMNQKVGLWPGAQTNNQKWMLRKTESGTAILIDNSHALTYDNESGRVYVTEFTDSQDQKWIFEEYTKSEDDFE